MIGGMIGMMIAEVVGEMIAAVIANAVTIAETIEEMLGVNLMRIAETLLCVSRPRLPLLANEQGTTIEMTTRLKMPRMYSSLPSRTTSATYAGLTRRSMLWLQP